MSRGGISALVACAGLAVWVGGLASAGGGSPRSREPAHVRPGDPHRVAAELARLPLAFEPNRGQLGAGALFAARGAGYGIVLTRRGLQLGLGHAHLSLSFSGSAGPGRIATSAPLRERVNYLIGRDRSNWRTGIPTFKAVRYSGLWPGVGAVFRGSRGRLEYDFHVAPDADPSRIGLTLAGARGVEVDASGALVSRLPGGPLRQLAPHAYQQIGSARHMVASAYALSGDHVSFRLGPYDHARPLVIDPPLAYSTYLGGTGDDVGRAVAVDANGAAYVTGLTLSTDFPTIAGAPQTATGGSEDAFVSKLDPAGTGLVYSTYLGGSSIDEGHAILVDRATGAVYIAGRSDSPNFPATAGAFQTSKSGSEDAFVAKLNPSGSSLIYATYFGGNNNTTSNGLAVDAAGDAYITGFTQSTTLPTTAGAFQTSFGGSADAYMTEFNPTGTAPVYSTYLDGSGNDQGTGIALDPGGAVYVAGVTTSTDFPVTAGALQPAAGGGNDAFVTKLSTKPSVLPFYSTYLGGAGDELANGIAVDSTGAAHITGQTTSANFPTTAGAPRSSRGGTQDAFVTKLAPGGASLAYSTYLGGTGADAGVAIALDQSNARTSPGSRSQAISRSRRVHHRQRTGEPTMCS